MLEFHISLFKFSVHLVDRKRTLGYTFWLKGLHWFGSLLLKDVRLNTSKCYGEDYIRCKSS